MKTYRRPAPPMPVKKPGKMMAFFKTRGISEETVNRNKIFMAKTYMPAKGEEVNAIAFPFYKNKELVNIKYRDGEKNFKQEKDAEKVFYGYDDANCQNKVYIVEGEMDKLTLDECGILECLSVPDGAPSPTTKSFSTKMNYIENCMELLESIDKFVIAVDNDPAGHTLQAELVRRLGPEKCWTVTWPEGVKDANECLLKEGKEKLYEVLASAHPVPVEGIFEVKDLDQAIDDLYDNGLQGGESTGWRNLDDYYTVKQGEFSMVTGIPSHGKSTWVDALLVNLAEKCAWNFAIFSPENQPLQRHMASIIQQYARLPFGSWTTSRLSKEELITGKAWVGNHFVFLLPPENELTIDGVLSKAKVAVTRYGIQGLVIDPWNELDHSRPSGMTEPEYISDCLSKIRRFARKYMLHIWVIAHPTKLPPIEVIGKNGQKERTYPVPTPYDISGAAHWRNKADNCICVWRDVMDEEKNVDIHIQKIRFREVGRVGLAHLKYDVLSGRYSEAWEVE